MLAGMRRPLGVLCLFVFACTSSAPDEKQDGTKQLEDRLEQTKQEAIAQRQEAAKKAEEAAKNAEEAAKKAEIDAAMKAEAAKKAEQAAKLAGSTETPMVVMLGGTGSRTSKPVANAVLGHSWGWGSANAADTAACEAKASTPGEQMACGTEDKPKGAAQLLAKLELPAGKSAFVTPEQIADWNIAAPTSPVWLFGPERACQATVGRPLVGWYSIDESGEQDADPDLNDHFTVLELAWELTGCDAADETWARIGVAAAAFDPTTRWVTVKAGEPERLDPATWSGLLASEVAKLPDAAKSREDAEPVSSEPEWWTQTFELPGTEIRELYFAAVWRAEGSKPPGEYQCGDSEFNEVFQVRLSASGASMLGRGSRGRLVGALVTGTEVHTMVWTDSLDYLVAKLEPTGLADSVDLSTGVYYPEDGGDRHYTLLPYCGP
jgi:hypothetical protein